MMIKSLLILVSILNLCPSPLEANDSSHLQTYIVHVEEPESHFTSQSVDLESWYRSFLPTTIATTEADRRIVYSYSLVFKGFAARLSPQEVRAMEEREGFISGRAERKLSLHTTRSPHFLGLQNNTGFWRESNYGRGVIIGVLDTGVSPEHPSFSDEGMPPPPAKWKGMCEFNNITCNNKIIGARYFRRDSGDSPIDDEGHGTHTASTAAGNAVPNANLLGEANGTAVGIAPRAHLAIYRVCSPDCLESEILAAMDTAIEDGVDVLSLSLGGPPLPFYEDSIALGAFSAMQRNISVSCSAGNSGPSYYSVSNGAPWLLTVGASTIDRNITATAVTGDDEKLDGQSAFQPKNFSQKHFPLVYSRMLNPNDSELPYCTPESLNRTNVRGKIVVCEMGLVGRVEKGRAVRNAGGVGMILVNPPPYANMTLSDPHLIPATHVTYAAGLNIIDYINSTRNPNATFLFKGTMIGDRRAPVVAAFSSRGPNLASPGILKPDIVGPGVNILAAWLPSAASAAKPTWNIISGTSMSCPHLSGVAALLKSSHPDWSPAAIKSAIMTTADVVNRGGDPILDEEYLPADIFTTGAGHVNPARANDPGLVYDIHPDDYIPYLCGLGYTSRQVGVIAQRRVDCMAQPTISEAQLNYPSWSLNFGPRRPASQTYSRTVTNVGEPDSCYVVEIQPPRGVDVAVEPARLEFEEMYQTMEYNVTFRRTAAATGNNLVEGFLKWVSSKSNHSVRSRIAVIM